MTDFLARLAERTLGLTPRIQPLLVSRYVVPSGEPVFADTQHDWPTSTSESWRDPPKAWTDRARGPSPSEVAPSPPPIPDPVFEPWRDPPKAWTHRTRCPSSSEGAPIPPPISETDCQQVTADTDAAPRPHQSIPPATPPSTDGDHLPRRFADERIDAIDLVPHQQPAREPATIHEGHVDAATTDALPIHQVIASAPTANREVARTLPPTSYSMSPDIVQRPSFPLSPFPADEVSSLSTVPTTQSSPSPGDQEQSGHSIRERASSHTELEYRPTEEWSRRDELLPTNRETGQPMVRVTIGRIDVRAIASLPSSTRPAPPRPPPSVLSLDEYLRQRGGSER